MGSFIFAGSDAPLWAQRDALIDIGLFNPLKVYDDIFVEGLIAGLTKARLFFFQSPFFSFTETVGKESYVRPHQNRVLDKFLHAVHESISVAARHKSLISRLTFVRKLSVCLGNRRLVGNGKHAHPSTEDSQRVDCIKGL